MNSANTTVAKVAIPVSAFVTHGNVHLDEIASVWLLTTIGKNLFPLVVEKPEIRFVTQNPRGDDEEYDSMQIIPVGCGGGRFDEHTQNGRKFGECSATLVAKYLGVESRPGVREILADVLACDTKVGTHGLQMAEIVKAAHRCMPGSEGDHSVIKWAVLGLGWSCHQIKMSYAPKNGHEPGAMSMFERWVKYDSPPEKTVTFVRRLCEESEKRNEVTGLDFITRAMHRSGRSIKEIFEWSLTAFRWLQNDQAQFWFAVEEIRTGKPDKSGVARSVNGRTSQSFLVPSIIDGEKRHLKMLVVQSDNRRAHRAAMWLKPDVFVLRHSDGHTQIFCHRQSGLGQDEVADIVAHLRFWEGGKDAGTSWMDLRVPGNVKFSPVWYYFPEAGQILNGSETHMGVPPTTLPLTAIVQAVRRALWLPDLRRWQEELGIELPDIEKEKARPLASVGEIAETHDRENGNGDKETKGA